MQFHVLRSRGRLARRHIPADLTILVDRQDVTSAPPQPTGDLSALDPNAPASPQPTGDPPVPDPNAQAPPPPLQNGDMSPPPPPMNGTGPGLGNGGMPPAGLRDGKAPPMGPPGNGTTPGKPPGTPGKGPKKEETPPPAPSGTNVPPAPMGPPGNGTTPGKPPGTPGKGPKKEKTPPPAPSGTNMLPAPTGGPIMMPPNGGPMGQMRSTMSTGLSTATPVPLSAAGGISSIATDNSASTAPATRSESQTVIAVSIVIIILSSVVLIGGLVYATRRMMNNGRSSPAQDKEAYLSSSSPAQAQAQPPMQTHFSPYNNNKDNAPYPSANNKSNTTSYPVEYSEAYAPPMMQAAEYSIRRKSVTEAGHGDVYDMRESNMPVDSSSRNENDMADAYPRDVKEQYVEVSRTV